MKEKVQVITRQVSSRENELYSYGLHSGHLGLSVILGWRPSAAALNSFSAPKFSLPLPLQNPAEYWSFLLFLAEWQSL